MSAIGLRLGGRPAARWWPESAVAAADFVNGRYMLGGAEVAFGTAFAFLRDTPAMMADGRGNWVEFPANQLRRLPGLGAVFEPAATNYLRGTDNIGGGGWSPMPPRLTRSGAAGAGFTLTVNEANSGLMTVEQYGYLNFAASVPTYFSIDVHDSGLRGVALWFSDVGYRADFDTAIGVATGQGPSDVASMFELGGGWWRCRVRHVHTAGTNAWRIKLGASRASSTYAVGDFIRLRAPQAETGTFTTPVVNASASQSVTRSSDQIALLAGGTHDVVASYADGATQTIAATNQPLDGGSLLGANVMHLVWLG